MSKYYVSNTGSDSAAGAIDAPFRTLAKLYATVTLGDEGFLENGSTFTETLQIRKRVNFSAYGDASRPKPLIHGQSSRAFGVQLQAASDGSVFRNIATTGHLTNGWNFESGMTGTGMDLWACDSYSNGLHGFGGAGGLVFTGLNFWDCTAYQNTGSGFSFVSEPGVTIYGGASWGHTNGNGVILGGGPTFGIAPFILPTGRAVPFKCYGNSTGIKSQATTGAVTLDGVFAYQNLTNSIYLVPATNVSATALVKNCVVLTLSNPGAANYGGIRFDGLTTGRFYNNHVFLGNAGANSRNAFGFWQDGTAGDTAGRYHVLGNVFWFRDNAYSFPMRIDTPVTISTWDYNAIHHPSTYTAQNVYSVNGSASTRTAWKNQASLGTSDRTVDGRSLFGDLKLTIQQFGNDEGDVLSDILKAAPMVSTPAGFVSLIPPGSCPTAYVGRDFMGAQRDPAGPWAPGAFLPVKSRQR